LAVTVEAEHRASEDDVDMHGPPVRRQRSVSWAQSKPSEDPALQMTSDVTDGRAQLLAQQPSSADDSTSAVSQVNAFYMSHAHNSVYY